MMPDPSSGDDAQGASDDGRSLFCDMQRAPRGSTCGLPFAYAACRAACGCDFACVFVCGMPCACTPVRSPVCDTPRCGRAAAKRLVPRSASCPLPGCCSVRRGCGRRGVRCDFACVFVCGMPCACTPVRSPVCDTPRCGRAAAKRLVPRSASCPLPGCCSVRRGCGRRGVRCDFACVFVCGMPCACTPVRSPVCDTPRCGRAAAKRLVPRSASCPLPGCCSVRRGCGRRGGIRRLRSAPRNSIRASRRRGCRPRKRRRGRRRRAVQRS